MLVGLLLPNYATNTVNKNRQSEKTRICRLALVFICGSSTASMDDCVAVPPWGGTSPPSACIPMLTTNDSAATPGHEDDIMHQVPSGM